MSSVRILSRASAAIALLLASVGAFSAEPYTPDLGHTRITFEVEHLGFSIMPGVFRSFDVEFTFDPDAPQDSSLDVAVDASSVDMFHDGLNEHLVGEDFFDVSNYPTFRFRSTEVVSTSATTATVTGDMTLLGVTAPVSFDVTLNKMGANPFSGTPTVGFAAEGSLDRTVFGMNYAAPMVGATINFTLAGEFSPAETEVAQPQHR